MSEIINITDNPFWPKSIKNLAPKYKAAINEVSDERNNGDGWWIYLNPPYFNTNLECAIIHEQSLLDCIQQLKVCVNKPVTKEQYFQAQKDRATK